MKKRIFSILIVVCMAFNMLPASIIATSNEDISTNSFDSDVPCENHQEHTFGEDGCGYIETVIAHECNHVHNDDCEFVAAAKAQEKTEEIPCDKECKGEHSANCAYSPAKEAITGTVGQTCRHTHDVKCGFAEAVAGSPCTHKCELNNAAVMTQLDPKQLTNWDSVATGNFEEKATSLKSYTFYDDNRSPVLLTVETDKKLGSMENPISIANEADLIRFGKQDSDDTSDKYYVLDKEDGVYDMDGSKKYMLPLFKEVVSTDSDMPSKYNAFQGILAGNGATITNASIGDYSGFNGAYSPGLFSGIENRGIYDLTLKDSSFYIGNLVSTTLEYVGGIVARAKNAEIVNCHTSNNNYSGLSHLNRNFMGGIVGYTDGNILNCSNTSDISGKGNYLSLGGIAGSAEDVTNSYNTSGISGK